MTDDSSSPVPKETVFYETLCTKLERTPELDIDHVEILLRAEHILYSSWSIGIPQLLSSALSPHNKAGCDAAIEWYTNKIQELKDQDAIFREEADR